MSKKKLHGVKGQTQRQQRVGEEIRHVLSSILQRREIWSEILHRFPVTISEVKVSVDMAHAFVFVMPLGGQHIQDVLEELQKNKIEMRKLLARDMHLRIVPQLHFYVDTVFDTVERIERLLKNPHVVQDLLKDSA